MGIRELVYRTVLYRTRIFPYAYGPSHICIPMRENCMSYPVCIRVANYTHGEFDTHLNKPYVTRSAKTRHDNGFIEFYFILPLLYRYFEEYVVQVLALYLQ